jgi:hypothetical protein
MAKMIMMNKVSVLAAGWPSNGVELPAKTGRPHPAHSAATHLGSSPARLTTIANKELNLTNNFVKTYGPTGRKPVGRNFPSYSPTIVFKDLRLAMTRGAFPLWQF